MSKSQLSTSVAALVVAALAGTSASAQVIDLRYPPYAAGYPAPATRQRLTTTDFEQQYQSRYRTVDHQSVSTLPGLGGLHGAAGAIGQLGAHPAPQHHGGYPAPEHHGGYPIGAPQAAPAFVPGLPGPGIGGSCPTGPSPAIGAVDALIAQVGAFLQVFGPTAHCVPEGDCIYRDALELYQAALAFRQAALAGAQPCDLRTLHAAMDGACCRLVTRVNRLSCGRTGPNIEQVQYIAALCNQVRAFI